MTAHDNRAARRRRATAQTLRAISRLLLLIGMIALGYTTFFIEDSRHFQRSGTEAIANASLRPAKALVAEGSPIGRLEIPRLDLDVIVAQGDSDNVLRRAVGHIPGTPMPGEAGNVALAGHRDTFFRPLRKIQRGDVITIQTPTKEFRYEVESTSIVAPNDMSVLRPAADQELTLITCFPFYYVGSAPKRFVVRAHNLDHAVIDPPVR